MLALSFLIVVISMAIALKFFVKTFAERLFLCIFTVSTIYYGVLGPWYWAEFKDGYFIGVNWSDSFPLVIAVFVLVYILVVFIISFLRSSEPYYPTDEVAFNASRLLQYAGLIVGFASFFYTYFVGKSLLARGYALTDNPIVLICFQFANLPIGILLFWAATKGMNQKWFLMAFVYTVFGVIVGLRIKILLLWVPIAIAMFLVHRSPIRKFIVRSNIIIGLFAIVVGFTIMTFSRIKFSGLDTDAITGAGLDTLLYGLFADTNVIFGLASCLAIFGDKIPFAGWSPIMDVFVQFVPRFVYPDKSLYGDLLDAAWWIAESDISLKSGTAMPFFGQYYAAFGWFGLGVGVVLYVFIVMALLKLIREYSTTYRQYLTGISLVCLFFGFYYFSRGSLAQIFKDFIFICVPYLYLLLMSSKRQISMESKVKQ